MNKIVLDNGLRLLLLPEPQSQVFSIDVWVCAGSRFEAGWPGGISHLTEHMVFKGTTRRTSRQISEEMDDMGGSMNAYTGQEDTRFYIQTLSENAGKAADLLQDMLLNSTFPEKELEMERQVVLEEIAMYEDSPEDLAHDGLTEAVWQGSQLGAPIAGSRESVSSVTGEQLREFLRQTYTPERMIVVCAGGFDPVAMERQLRDSFGRMAPGGGSPRPDTARFCPSLTLRKKDFEQVSLELAFPGIPAGSDERFAMTLLNFIAGGGETSRLYQRLREELGLTYGIYATNCGWATTGMFIVAASLSPENQGRALEEIRLELERLRTGGVTPAELRRAKVQSRTSCLLGLETVAARASLAGRCERTFGRMVPPVETLAAIDRVTADELCGLAQKILSAPPALAVVGPIEDEAFYAPYLRAMVEK